MRVGGVRVGGERAHHAARAGAEGGAGAEEAQAAAAVAPHTRKAADAVWARLEPSDGHEHVAPIRGGDYCGRCALHAEVLECDAGGSSGGSGGSSSGGSSSAAAGTCCLQDSGSRGRDDVTASSRCAASQRHTDTLLSSSLATNTVSECSGCQTRCLREALAALVCLFGTR